MNPMNLELEAPRCEGAQGGEKRKPKLRIRGPRTEKRRGTMSNLLHDKCRRCWARPGSQRGRAQQGGRWQEEGDAQAGAFRRGSRAARAWRVWGAGA